MTDIENHTDAPLVPLDDISPYGSNPKEHPDEQIDDIASSIRRFGWNQNLVIDDEGVIITGHGRRLAAKQLGEDKVPAIRRPEMSEAEKRAYRIADNRVTESEWDDPLLFSEIELLREQEISVEATGFSSDGIDDVEKGVEPDEEEIEEAFDDLPDGERDPIRQRTFTLAEEQLDTVETAVERAKENAETDHPVNSNDNGNALAVVCEGYLRPD